MRLLRSTFTAVIVIIAATMPVGGQTPAPTVGATVHAIFLSDIHLDVFKSPDLVAKLAGQPVAAAEPSSPLAAAQQHCLTLPDTSDDLFRSSLASMQPHATSVSFVTVSGDLISHQFIRCFAAFALQQQPKDSEAAQYAALTAEQRLRYRSFVQKSIEYITGSIHDTFPNTPVYYALGNNDTDCGDYFLDPHGEFLHFMSEIIVNSLPPNLSAADRATVRADVSIAGYYSTPLAGAPNTRMIVLGDLFMHGGYATCAGKPDAAPAEAQLAWLHTQLDSLNPGEDVWLMGHIPPGLDLYSSAKQRKPVTFLKYGFDDQLAAQKGVIRVGIFAHTHIDGISQVQSADPAHPMTLKMVQAISTDHGNPPTYTLADIDAKTGALLDYTLITAAKSAGGFTWPAADAPLPAFTWAANSR